MNEKKKQNMGEYERTKKLNEYFSDGQIDEICQTDNDSS